MTLPRLVGLQPRWSSVYRASREGRRGPRPGPLRSAGAAGRASRRGPRPGDEIAVSAPLAVASIRETLRVDLPDAIRRATDREKAEQDRLQKTDDWREGTKAMAERRTPIPRGAEPAAGPPLPPPLPPISPPPPFPPPPIFSLWLAHARRARTVASPRPQPRRRIRRHQQREQARPRGDPDRPEQRHGALRSRSSRRMRRWSHWPRA